MLAISGVTNAATLNASVPKPKYVTASASNSSALVKWTKATSTAKYKITGYQVTATKGTWKSVKTLSSALTSVRFTGLTNNSLYRFTVASLSGKYVSAGVAVTATPKASLLGNSVLFGQPADMFLGAADQQLYAIAAGPDPIFTALTPNVCSIIGTKVHAKALGDCIIRAAAPANEYYLASVPIDRLLSIGTEPAPIVKTLLWSDEFNGAQGAAPDSTKWTADTTDGCGAPYNNCGWGNSERQYYLASKNTQDGSNTGVLNIQATRQTNSTSYNCYFGKCEWLSGKITTYNKVGFTYGYIETRAKLPSGDGAWPAFWMLGSNIASTPWPACGELDIMEYKGSAPQITHGTVHYANSGGSHEYKGGTRDALVDLSVDYHRYGMMWTADEIAFYLDDNIVYNMRKSDSGLARWPFGPNAQGQAPSFYVIFNLAMGGQFGGSIDPTLNQATLSVDWVRYYSIDGVGKVNAK
jgi:beta-glucanase (GH16 family)